MKKSLLLIAVFLCCLQTISYAQHAGDLDSTFGTNGVVKTDIGGSFNCDYFTIGNQVLLQPDGSMFIIAETNGQTIIAKKLTDGSTDVSYGNKGYSVPVDIFPSHAVMQPDGKVVVAGGFAIARYNIDGSLDNSFSGDGIQTSDFGSANSIVLQRDGKIVVAGAASNGTNYDFALARYNTDGSLDITFSGDGKQTTDFGSFDYGYAVAIQSDGKIVVAGSTYTNSFYDLALARYNTDGSLDNSFSGDGRQTTYFHSPYYSSYSLAIQSDGKIVVTGDSYITQPASFEGSYYFTLARFNTDGSLDNTFSEDGKQITGASPYNYRASSLAIQSDGKIVVAGNSSSRYGDTSYFVLVRYNINGSVDNSFSVKGKQATDSITLKNAKSIAIQSDGKIVVAGSSSNGFAIARYKTNGSLDNTFDMDGTLSGKVCLNQGNTSYSCIAIQSDGKIVAAGPGIVRYNATGSDIVRYNKDGSLDNTFSENGYQTVDYGITSIAIQSDGKIVVAGSVIARYNTDGSPDNTFSGDGRQTTAFYIASMAIQSDNRIVVAGDSSIARFTATGDIDMTFSEDGIQKTSFGIASVAIQNDQKVVAAGSLTGEYDSDDLYEENNNDFAVARFNTDGSLDKGFGSGGVTTTDFYYDGEYVRYHGNDVAFSVAIQSDGKIVVAGRSRGVFGGGGDNGSLIALARYNNDGSLDFQQRAVPDPNGPIAPTPIAIQKNGKIVLAASAAEPGELTVLTRFNADGSADNTFGKNGIQLTRNVINGIEIANNELYAVGFGLYPGELGIVEKYFLDDEIKAPTVNLTIPNNIVKYTAPARIKLNATVANASGTITKVQFFNGTTRLHTETVYPYGFLWIDVPAGKYTLTAKAFDNSGNVTTSNAISVSVVDYNVPPVVSIVSPVNNTTYAGPATIRLIANAKDPNDKISKVEFYNGTTLLRTEFNYPYTYTWTNVGPGTYTITAKAYNDKGLSATSAPVKVKVTNASIVNRPSSIDSKTDLNGTLSMKLSPNPARSSLQIYTNGLQQNKSSTISVISASGVIMKIIQSNASNKVVQLDVSSMVSGVYTVKVVSGDRIMYKQFVKL